MRGGGERGDEERKEQWEGKRGEEGRGREGREGRGREGEEDGYGLEKEVRKKGGKQKRM